MLQGPVEYIVIEFPGNAVNSDIAPALQRLVTAGTVRIIDLMFIRKDADGHIQPLEVNQLEGAAALRYEDLDGEIDDLVNEADIQTAAAELAPNSVGVVLIWEDVWATPFAEAVRANGGRIVQNERIPRATVEAALQATVEAQA